jgi:signal transduction histidine kinase
VNPGRQPPSRSQLGYRSAALIEIMLDLAAERDSQRLVRNFCYGAKELINAREASVHIVAPGESQNHLFFSTSTSTSDSFSPPTCDCGLIGLAKQAMGRCLRKAEGAELGIVPPQQAAGSVLYVPINGSANCFGCLCLVEKLGEQDFSQEDERLISTLTAELALVYENIRLYKELERFATRVALESEARQRTQEELDFSRQEQVRLKDQFLSHVSHELRSPVMVLHQFLEILLEGIAGEVNEQQRGYLDIALRNTNELNTMIGDLLEATRIETGKLRVDLKSMSLQEVLNEATESARPAAEQKHLTLSLDTSVGLPMVIADRSRTRQIVTNFLENAIKFTPENGAITVQAAADREDSRFVRVEVTDTGCGIGPDETDKIFDRLYQVPNADSAARKGLGLGLSICKQLVTLQGGEIQVTSQPGAGSTFSFTLPVFSVASLAEPMLGEDLVPESIFLLTVELCNSGSADKNVAASVREIIERCVLPDLDAVMPDTYDIRNGQMFVVLARADERGAQVLARRLEDQLKLNPHVAALPGPPLVRLSTMDLSVARQNPIFGEQRAAVVAKIEESLKAILANRS